MKEFIFAVSIVAATCYAGLYLGMELQTYFTPLFAILGN